MLIRRYKKEIIILIPILAFSILLFIFQYSGFMQAENTMITFVPGIGLMDQGAWVLLSIGFVSLVIANISGFVLGPIFLVIHKMLSGKRISYYIQERPFSEKFKDTFKGFFPSLMAINFALMFALLLVDIVVTQSWIEASEGFEAVAPLVSFFGLTVITSGIAMALFSPVWFLLDSGIVYTNKEKVEDSTDPIEVQSVGGWLDGVMKGYAGIGVILEFVTFSLAMLMAYGENISAMIIALVIIPIFPFIITILTLPAIILLDIIREQRRVYIRNFAKKLGITQTLEMEFKIS